MNKKATATATNSGGATEQNSPKEYRVIAGSINEYEYCVTASSPEDAEDKVSGFVGEKDDVELPGGVKYAGRGHNDGEIQYVYVW